MRLSIWYLFFSCKPCRRQHSAGCHARQFKIRVFEALRSPTRLGTSQLGHLPEKRERIPLGSFSLSREYTCGSREHLRSAVSTRVNWSELCGIVYENVRLCRCVVALEAVWTNGIWGCHCRIRRSDGTRVPLPCSATPCQSRRTARESLRKGA